MGNSQKRVVPADPASLQAESQGGAGGHGSSGTRGGAVSGGASAPVCPCGPGCVEGTGDPGGLGDAGGFGGPADAVGYGGGDGRGGLGSPDGRGGVVSFAGAGEALQGPDGHGGADAGAGLGGADGVPRPEGHGESEGSGGHDADGRAELRATLTEFADVFHRLTTALHGVQETVEEIERGLRTIDLALFAYVERRVEAATRAAEERVENRLRERLRVRPVDQPARMEEHSSPRPVMVHQQTITRPPRYGRVGNRHSKAPISSKRPGPLRLGTWWPLSKRSALTRYAPFTNSSSTTSSSSTPPAVVSTSASFQRNPPSAAPRPITSDGESVAVKKRLEFSSAQLPTTSVSKETPLPLPLGGSARSDAMPTEYSLPSTSSYHPEAPPSTSSPTTSETAGTSAQDSAPTVRNRRKTKVKRSGLLTSRSRAYKRSRRPVRESRPTVTTPLAEAGTVGEAMSLEEERAINAFLSAAEAGNAVEVQRQLAGGMSVNAECEAGFTALHYAVAAARSDMVRFLLTRGAHIHARSNDGTTPLHHAATRDFSGRMTTQLVASGAGVNSRNYENWTPLHSAAVAGNMRAAKVLLQEGANASIENHKRETPLMLAQAPEMIELLGPVTSRLDRRSPIPRAATVATTSKSSDSS